MQSYATTLMKQLLDDVIKHGYIDYTNAEGIIYHPDTPKKLAEHLEKEYKNKICRYFNNEEEYEDDPIFMILINEMLEILKSICQTTDCEGEILDKMFDAGYNLDSHVIKRFIQNELHKN